MVGKRNLIKIFNSFGEVHRLGSRWSGQVQGRPPAMKTFCFNVGGQTAAGGQIWPDLGSNDWIGVGEIL